MTNSRTLVFGGYGRQVAIDDLDAGDYNSKPWMVPNGDMGDGEVSRDGKRLAVTIDYGAEHEARVLRRRPGTSRPSSRPRTPSSSCSTTTGDEKFGDLSWSPDGSGIAYESSKGITISRFTKFEVGDCAAPNDLVLSATGSEPDWGPAAPPAAAYKPPVVTPDPGPVTPDPIVKPTKPGAKLTIAKATAKALRKGLAVTVDGAGQGPRDGHGDRRRSQGRERQRDREEGRQGHGQALEGQEVAQGQDPHPQVDLQRRGERRR